jgi:fatty-acyl-CoA synthase
MLRGEDGLRKLGSAGTPCFFTDLRVVGPSLEPVRPGEPGEVLVQGPNVTAGYWNQSQATSEALLPGGWRRTGDLATVDDEGYLSIVGRLKDMYISGGENVYPAEVEQAIYAHPAVAECAVIGVPDEKWGEVGRAVIVTRPGQSLREADLIQHLEGRLARYKLPRTVVFTDGLPHNASGKLVKARVRELHGGIPAPGVKS